MYILHFLIFFNQILTLISLNFIISIVSMKAYYYYTKLANIDKKKCYIYIYTYIYHQFHFFKTSNI